VAPPAQGDAILTLNIACLVGLFPAFLGLLLSGFVGGQLLLMSVIGWVLALVWAATAVRNDKDLVAIIDKPSPPIRSGRTQLR
jgi:hypothetical protein